MADDEPRELLLGADDDPEALVRKLLDSAPDAMTVVDAEGRIVLFNRRAEQLFGYTHAELLGCPIERLVPARLRAEHVAHRAAFSAAPRLRPMGSGRELYGQRSDGSEFAIEISLSPVRVSTGPLTAASIRDISVRRREETALRHAHARAEAASSAKSEILASLSHELRTPLYAILGFTELLQRDKKTPLAERQRERLEHVQRAGEHLLRVIDDVLDLARVEAGAVPVALESVVLESLLAEVRGTLEPMADQHGIRLQLAPLPADAPRVLGDRTRLKQILMNYGSNAIKYGVRGGMVELSVCNADMVVISVRDDGIGITSERHDKLFQPFERAGQESGPIEGTGIGLAISKRLAELMQGEVGFDSAPGQGSRFWIALRRAP